jgi:carbon-monoxide dehydrogenase medium subunit
LKPPRFKYIAPRSPEEAVEYLARYEGDARCLSGGQSLLPLMNFRVVRPQALIDLNRCGNLDYLRRDDDRLIIGPMTPQSTAEHSDLVRACCPLLSKTLPYLGPPTIRNRGTIGGTLAHADRNAELPAVAVVLEAELIAQGPQGLRTIAADEFFHGDLTTDLRADEMLREIRFPISQKRSICAFVEANNRHHDLALAGIAVFLLLDDDRAVERARLSCIGIGPRPIRLKRVEQTLCGTRADDAAIEHAQQFSLDGIEPEGDIHASAEYRRALLPRLVRRALEQAVADGPKE